MPVLTVAQILSGTDLGLNSGLEDLLILETGGRRVLYALNRAENQLIEIEISSSGSVTVAGSLGLSGTFSPGGDPELGKGFDANGDAFLTLSGLPPADGQTVSLTSTGALGTQGTLANVGELTASVGLLTGGVPVLVSNASSGLAFYADTGNGYAAGAGLADSGDRYLADVSAAVSFEEAGSNLIATVSRSEAGVNIVSASATGLTQMGALGNSEGLPIGAPEDIAVVSRLNETLLFIASSGTSSLSVAKVENGAPALADHILDDAGTRLQGATAVAAVNFGDFAYVAAAGAEGGVSVFTALPGGRLVHLDSVSEDETVPLNKLSSLEALVVGDTLHLFAGSGNEIGLARLEYDLSTSGQVVIANASGSGATGTPGDDQLVGSVVGELLDGQAGNDILLDGQGSDSLTGGSGSDLFAFSADGVSDQITDFERGVDLLDLSAFDFLYDVSQLDILPLGNGARLTFGAETIFVFTADGLPLTSADLTNEDILNVNRSPFLLIGREIVGTSADEVLNGGPGNDTIAAAGGNDSVTGGYGLDILLGSFGQDSLNGDAGADTIVGGSGNDLINGGDGGDVIYGDEWM